MNDVINKKKEALLSKKARLLKELEALDNTIEGVIEEEWETQGKIILTQIDALLELVPFHDDGSIDEGHDDPNCLKCVLLEAKMNDSWDYKKYGIIIELENRLEEKLQRPAKEHSKEIKKDIKPKRKPGRPKKKELSENQQKARELGMIDDDGTPKKFNRVLEVDESAVDLPEDW